MKWDATLRDCSLETVLNALYGREINCGLASFWDGGWRAWIGDDMNGRRAEADFDRDQLHLIPEWLVTTAERQYPAILENA